MRRYHSHGFTLVEIILAVAALAVITGITAPIASNFAISTDLRIARDNVMSALAAAKTRAHHQSGDSEWGVHVVDDRATLFRGTSFQGRDTAFDTTFSIARSVSVSGDNTFIFSRLSGAVDESGTVELATSDEDTVTIQINEIGIATVQ